MKALKISLLVALFVGVSSQSETTVSSKNADIKQLSIDYNTLYAHEKTRFKVPTRV